MTDDRPKVEISVKGQDKWQRLYNPETSHPFLPDSEAVDQALSIDHLTPLRETSVNLSLITSTIEKL